MSPMSVSNLVLIVDFGGQFSHLISRRIRDLGVNTILISPQNYDQKVDNLGEVGGIILSGGPRSVGDMERPEIPNSLKKVLDSRSSPVLGICFGHQILGKYFGGELGHSSNQEYGRTKIKIEGKSVLFDDDVSELTTWMSHGDHVSKLPPGFELLASSNNCAISAMQSLDNKIFGVQFHPEVTHTENGFELLRKFIFEVCGLEKKGFSMKQYSANLINEMKEEIGDNKVLLGVSGGVDSSVASMVLHEAIGDNLYLLFIDHGLLRKNEAENVIDYFENILKIKNFHFVDASELFLKRLSGIIDPEEKRKIIGHSFIDVFEEKAKELALTHGNFKFLGQGTIYSDRVESGAIGSGTAKIKSHHNLTLPDDMNLQVIEPLKDLYKDEVRELGRLLGAPSKWINRYPFPGPGLAVRIVGEITRDEVRLLQEADYIFIEEIYKNKVDHLIWQAFAVLLPGKAVGVMGDSRAYGRIIALRAVQSEDGMTADFAKIPHDILGKISTRIINEVKEVTRVLYDISTKPPATIEFE